MTDHRSGFPISTVRGDEVTLYPMVGKVLSPRDYEEPAPLIVQTIPPEIDDEDFQIPIHSSKRQSEFKLSSSNRYSLLGKSAQHVMPLLSTNRERKGGDAVQNNSYESSMAQPPASSA